jgi:hypothetical protein
VRSKRWPRWTGLPDGSRSRCSTISDDETAAAVAATVEEFRERGLDVVHVRRTTRAGYKAGALAHGLVRAKGELIAVFDADFVPAPDFAKALAGHFAEPRVGMVQARWGHLNRDASLLTRTQGILLDGHFVIEHAARHRSGRFFNFNGTAGIWRKSCIEDAGGWQHDTLTEDLDLSYRAQLRGWNFVYVQDAVAPAELPVEMGAFKSQQHRWAQGSAQTARKLLPSILASRLPVRVKLESLFHLTSNAGYVLMLALAILMGPAVWFRRGAPWAQLAAVDLPLIALSLGSIGVFYAISQRAAYGRRAAVWRYIPVLLGVGIGISINGTRAVLAGLRGGDTEFRRTPKYALWRPEGRRRWRPAGIAPRARTTHGSSSGSASTFSGSRSSRSAPAYGLRCPSSRCSRSDFSIPRLWLSGRRASRWLSAAPRHDLGLGPRLEHRASAERR